LDCLLAASVLVLLFEEDAESVADEEVDAKEEDVDLEENSGEEDEDEEKEAAFVREANLEDLRN
jgi:hypothetical protein